jgi:hypothetical protein
MGSDSDGKSAVSVEERVEVIVQVEADALPGSDGA